MIIPLEGIPKSVFEAGARIDQELGRELSYLLGAMVTMVIAKVGQERADQIMTEMVAIQVAMNDAIEKALK